MASIRYINDTEAPITPIGGKTVAPGGIVEPRQYFDDEKGLTVTRHRPAPWVTLFNGTLPAELTGLPKYKKIEITNVSGAVVECVANGDNANPFPISDGTSKLLSLANDVYSLDITGAGDGSVYVVVMRR